MKGVGQSLLATAAALATACASPDDGSGATGTATAQHPTTDALTTSRGTLPTTTSTETHGASSTKGPADTATGTSGSTTVARGLCGDASVNDGEECDDGNTQSFDGCSAGCGIEWPVRQICAGDSRSCALTEQGLVKCWGGNNYGGLGLGDKEDRGDQPGEMGASLPPVALAMEVVQLSCGRITCALGNVGQVKCWGAPGTGLGIGSTDVRGDEPGEMGEVLPFVDVGEPAIKIDVAFTGACALLASGTLKCWGYNGFGELGLGDTEDRGDEPGEMGDALPPVDLGEFLAADIVGYSWRCARDVMGRLKCWGDGSWGHLGLEFGTDLGDEPEEMGDALPFVNLGKDRTVLQVAAEVDNTCVILDKGELKCWGIGEHHVLWPFGNWEGAVGSQPGDMGDNLPVFDFGARTVTAVQVGFHIACVILDDRSVKCWGWNDQTGIMGLGNADVYLGIPHAEIPSIDFGAGETVKQLAITYDHACVLLDSGHVKCWGQNSGGQLGYGDTNTRGDEPGEMGDALPYVEIF